MCKKWEREQEINTDIAGITIRKRNSTESIKPHSIIARTNGFDYTQDKLQQTQLFIWYFVPQCKWKDALWIIDNVAPDKATA
jgi:hypothetical protein